jgi:xanthine dehydrogenase accessory factor
MLDLYHKIIELCEQGIPAALVTVTRTKGSTPRKSGSKMIVQQDGSVFGSVGGSTVEAMVIEESLDCIKKNESRRTEHQLDDAEKADTGMICGGWMEFYIEPLQTMTPLYIFGGGHVAQPLARLAAQNGFTCTIIDDRPEYVTAERFPQARDLKSGDPVEIVQRIEFTENDFVAMVSRSHEQDFKVLRHVLKKQVRYLGLIGSKKKKKEFFARLKETGFTEKELKQIHIPIGLDIAAETPEEIAVSIVAEMIRERNKD